MLCQFQFTVLHLKKLQQTRSFEKEITSKQNSIFQSKSKVNQKCKCKSVLFFLNHYASLFNCVVSHNLKMSAFFVNNAVKLSCKGHILVLA